MTTHKVVSDQDWLAAHSAHLREEKQLTRQRDALFEKRRHCPGGASARITAFTTLAARFA